MNLEGHIDFNVLKSARNEKVPSLRPVHLKRKGPILNLDGSSSGKSSNRNLV